jgi:hypothetical protein
LPTKLATKGRRLALSLAPHLPQFEVVMVALLFDPEIHTMRVGFVREGIAE